MEMDSPRGRLYLMQAAMNKRIDLSIPFLEHMNLCLTCRACETACPSGVEFGHLMEKTRVVVLSLQSHTRISRWISSFFLQKVIPSHHSLSFLFKLLWIYERMGFQWLMRHTPINLLFPEKFRLLEGSLPRIPLRSFGRGKRHTFDAMNEKRGKVALFTGCIMDHLFPGVHRSTVRLLSWHGYEVVVPKEQGCCGALHSHIGDNKTARKLAESNLSVFQNMDLDAIIVNAAGCSAHLKNYHRYDTHSNSTEFTKKVKDLTEFLVEIGLRKPQNRLDLKVVYDEPCHLIHGQGITKEPKKLIKAIPGVTILPLEESDKCCGSAGIYSLSQIAMSLNILKRKMDFIEASCADAVVTANPGCQIQLEWGVRQRKSNVQVLHIADLLDRSYWKDKGYIRRVPSNLPSRKPRSSEEHA